MPGKRFADSGIPQGVDQNIGTSDDSTHVQAVAMLLPIIQVALMSSFTPSLLKAYSYSYSPTFAQALPPPHGQLPLLTALQSYASPPLPASFVATSVLPALFDAIAAAYLPRAAPRAALRAGADPSTDPSADPSPAPPGAVHDDEGWARYSEQLVETLRVLKGESLTRNY